MAPHAGMDDLIPLINKVLDVSRTADLELDLPRIAVVGSQSTGKSSVLESFVGRDFLPRGTGICTRCPLVLQLIHHPQEEYGLFSHKIEPFYDFHRIRDEISKETNRIAGENKISSTPINLKIYSSRVANLTLVDLPGLTQVAVRDQEAELPQKIRAMVREYIRPKGCLILAISAANADLATSEGLNLAKEVDPKGERTIGVLTKLDLMDLGTDARDIINNRTFPLKLGYVGVVNRSQQDIKDGVDMTEALQQEQEFLLNNYSELAECMGTTYLGQRLAKLLQEHICMMMPKLRKQIQAELRRWKEKAQEVAGSEPNSLQLIKLLRKFQVKLKEDIEGVGEKLDIEEFSIGTHIKRIFHSWFPQQIEQIVVEENELKRRIEIAISNVYGNKTHLNAADAALKAVLDREISKLRRPSVDAVDEVTALINRAIRNDLKELAGYQLLHDEVDELMADKVLELSEETKKHLEDDIEISKRYINHNHEDFRRKQRQPAPSAAGASEEILWNGILNKWRKFSSQSFWFVMTSTTLSWYKDATLRVNYYDVPLENLKVVKFSRGIFSRTQWLTLQHKDDVNIYRDQKKLILSAESDDYLDEFLTQLTLFADVEVTHGSGSNSGTGFQYHQIPHTSYDESSGFEILEAQEWTPESSDSVNDVLRIYDLVEPYLRIVRKDHKDKLPKIISTKYIHRLLEFAETELFILVRNEEKLMEEPIQRKIHREEILQKVQALMHAKEIISEFSMI